MATTIIPSRTLRTPIRRGILSAIAIALALTIGGGQAHAFQNKPATNPLKAFRDQGSWVKSTAIFLVVTIVGGYAWYFGVFPRLLRKSNPSWPLDAWRLASYGAWITTCLAAYAFKKPLMARVLDALLTGSPDALRDYFMELILLPLLALVGLLVIWNFRRDATNRARPA